MSDEPTVASLLAANERFYRTFEALDAAGMEALWEQSPRTFCVHPGWPPLVGAEPVMESWRRIIGNTGEIRFRLTAVSAHVAGDVGVVTVFESVSSEVSDERHSAGAISTNLFAFDGTARAWKIFHHHASHTVLPNQAPPETIN